MRSPISSASRTATASVAAPTMAPLVSRSRSAVASSMGKYWPTSHGCGTVAGDLAVDEHPAPAADLDDMAEIAERPIDLRAAHRRIPELGQHGIVDLVDGGQRLVFGQPEPARIDQPAMRQHLVVVDQDEIAAAARAARADPVAEVADRDGGDQAADEGVVDAPHRRAHVEQRLLQRRCSRTARPRRCSATSAACESAPCCLRQGEERDGVAGDRAVGTADRRDAVAGRGWRRPPPRLPAPGSSCTASASRTATGESTSIRPAAARAAISSSCSVIGSSRFLIVATCPSTTRAARSTSRRSAVPVAPASTTM